MDMQIAHTHTHQQPTYLETRFRLACNLERATYEQHINIYCISYGYVATL